MHVRHLIPYHRNIFFISAIMDCVGCEKCRLWGKLQVLGLGTALKILFSVDGDNNLNQPLQLQRNEVIALFNLLNRLSESVKFVHEKGSSIEEVIKEQSPPTVQKGASKPNLKLVIKLVIFFPSIPHCYFLHSPLVNLHYLIRLQDFL
jgi:hypothetical protein